MITTSVNISEVFYALRKIEDYRTANYIVNQLSVSCLEVTPEVAIKAAELKKEYKKQKLSYINCIGYILAQEHKLKFLTGDKEFKDFPNVEFVKK
ncbi:MAG: putative nucleic acid-binding protein [Patescibacteria group bacterium]|jgi:predicted nucleic acid-binding protein